MERTKRKHRKLKKKPEEHTTKKDKVTGLNPRQKKMCELYLADPERSKSKAYKLAGYICRGNQASVAACNMFKRPPIVAYIETREAELTEVLTARTAMDAEYFLSHLRACINFNVRAVFNDDNTCKSIHELDERTLMAIQSIEFVHGIRKAKNKGESDEKYSIIKKIHGWDKLKAMEMALNLTGLSKGLPDDPNKEKAVSVAALKKMFVVEHIEKKKEENKDAIAS